MLSFTQAGLLPTGDHPMTIRALRQSPLVVGPWGRSAEWDQWWRRTLVDSLEVLFEQLLLVGITNVYANGSFTSNKNRPEDIDGYFTCDFSEFASHQHPELVKLNPAWNLADRRLDENGRLKPLMWHRHRIELHPHFHAPLHGLSPAGMGPNGLPMYVPAFFRQTRSGEPKGIVRLLRDNHHASQ